MFLGAELGWRIPFGIGAVLGLIILCVRRFVPESPRWLLTHGRAGEANRREIGRQHAVDDLFEEQVHEHRAEPPEGQPSMKDAIVFN